MNRSINFLDFFVDRWIENEEIPVEVWSCQKGVTPTLFNDGIAGSLAIGNYLYYNGGYRTICVLKISSDLYTAPVRSI